MKGKKAAKPTTGTAPKPKSTTTFKPRPYNLTDKSAKRIAEVVQNHDAHIRDAKTTFLREVTFEVTSEIDNIRDCNTPENHRESYEKLRAIYHTLTRTTSIPLKDMKDLPVEIQKSFCSCMETIAYVRYKGFHQDVMQLMEFYVHVFDPDQSMDEQIEVSTYGTRKNIERTVDLLDFMHKHPDIASIGTPMVYHAAKRLLNAFLRGDTHATKYETAIDDLHKKYKSAEKPDDEIPEDTGESFFELSYPGWSSFGEPTTLAGTQYEFGCHCLPGYWRTQQQVLANTVPSEPERPYDECYVVDDDPPTPQNDAPDSE